jgi:hypothetical protein
MQFAFSFVHSNFRMPVNLETVENTTRLFNVIASHVISNILSHVSCLQAGISV